MQFDHVKRREFIALISTAAAWPVIARAQRPDRMRRIGVLMNVSESDADGQTRLVAFTHRIRELGWTDGDNVRLDIRWTGGNAERTVVTGRFDIQDTMWILRAGVNYKFGG